MAGFGVPFGAVQLGMLVPEALRFQQVEVRVADLARNERVGVLQTVEKLFITVTMRSVRGAMEVRGMKQLENTAKHTTEIEHLIAPTQQTQQQKKLVFPLAVSQCRGIGV